MRRTVIGAVVVVAAVGSSGSSAFAQDQGLPGGCALFGGNVAKLATSLGADFGGNASFVATTFGPRAFPEMVVGPEQDDLCG